MREAILYLFYSHQKVLMEYRITDAGAYERLLVSGGGVEDADKISGKDYTVVALLREISEELQQKVTVKEYAFLGTVQRAPTDSPFHLFIITNWTGKIPEYIIEDNKKEGELVWLGLSEAKESTDSITVTAIIKTEQFLKKLLPNS